MIDKLTAHQIYIQRYSGGVLNELRPMLRSLRNDVANRIALATEYESARLSLLMADLNVIIDGHFAPLNQTIFNNVDELALYEQSYAIKLLNGATVASVVIGAGASPEMLKAFIRNDAIRMAGEAPMTIDTLIGTFNKAYKRDIKTTLEAGILEAKTLDQISRDVLRVSNSRSKRQAEALVRTVINHAGASARKNTFRDYDNLFKGEKYVATLDSRTTLVCASNDGKIFPMSSGPVPPLHWQCRSVRVPAIKDEYSLNISDTRASVDGPVSSRVTYSGWLRRQSKEVQNEVLGIEKAKLFRSGKVSLDKFVDSSGKVYTLKELEVADSII